MHPSYFHRGWKCGKKASQAPLKILAMRKPARSFVKTSLEGPPWWRGALLIFPFKICGFEESKFHLIITAPKYENNLDQNTRALTHPNFTLKGDNIVNAGAV